jgi:hypothetical protein
MADKTFGYEVGCIPEGNVGHEKVGREDRGKL